MRKSFLVIGIIIAVLTSMEAFALRNIIGQEVVFRGNATGIRISYATDNAFIDNVDAVCDVHNTSILATGTISPLVTDTRISAVDGTAFVDTTDATFAADLIANVDKYLVIEDWNGYEIRGWIKAQGTGETLGAELIAVANDRDFSVDTGFWTREAGWTIGGGKAVATAVAAKEMYDAAGHLTSGGLYKTVGTYTDAGGTLLIGFGNAYKFISAGTAVVTYGTATGTTSRYYGSSFTGTVDDISWKQVLTPTINGVTIVSTRGGATYNWDSKETWFDYNSFVNPYTYTIYDRKLITDFADGSHVIEIYDSSGKMLRGILKSVGTGETLGADSLLGWDFTAADWLCWSGTKTNATTITATGAIITIGRYNTFAALGALHKITWDRDVTDGSPMLLSGSTTVGYATGDAAGKYVTCGGDRTWYMVVNDTSVGNTLIINTQSCEQVLTPSANGVKIVNIKNGTDYNFISRASGWTQNASSYYVIVKKLR
jgi:hypothetical protein